MPDYGSIEVGKDGWMPVASHASVPVDYQAPPPPPSALGAAFRGAVRSAIPTGGAIAGAEAAAPIGAEIGTAFGPIGTVAGGLVGGLGGALAGGVLANTAQDAALNAMPGVRSAIGQDPDQVQADEQAHPYATMAGELAPQALALNPTNILAKGLSATERVGAGAGMVVGGGIQGGQEAYREVTQDGQLDPAKLAMQTAAGAVFSGKARFGLPDIAGRASAMPSEPTPVSDNQPTSMLALTDQRGGGALTDNRGDAPIYNADANNPPTLALPAPADVSVDAGGQAATPPQAADALQRQQADAQAAEAQRIAGLQTATPDFTPGTLLDQLHGASLDGETAALQAQAKAKNASGPQKPVQPKVLKPDDYTIDLAGTLHTQLSARDYDGANQMLDALQQHIDTAGLPGTKSLSPVEAARRQSVIDQARNIVLDHQTHPDIPEPEPAGTPTATAAAANPAFQPPPAPELSPHPDHFRRGLLEGVLSDPETRNPIGRFITSLKGAGLDRAITPAESERIAQFEQERMGVKPEAPQAQDTTLGVPGAKPTPDLKLRPLSEAEAAHQERIAQQRAARQVPAEEPAGPGTVDLFTDHLAARDAKAQEAITAADAALADLKAPNQRAPLNRARALAEAGKIGPAEVEHVTKLTKNMKLADANQFLAIAERGAAERPAKVYDNPEQLRKLALEHEGAQGGAQRARAFQMGVDHELGTDMHPEPEGNKTKWFQEGRQAVRDADAALAAAKAQPKPETPPAAARKAAAAPTKGEAVAQPKAALSDHAKAVVQNVKDLVESGRLQESAAKVALDRLQAGEDPAKIQALLDNATGHLAPTKKARVTGSQIEASERIPQTQGAQDAVRTAMRTALDSMGLKDVQLEVHPDIDGVKGDYLNKIVRLSMASAENVGDLVHTTFHEAFHAMRDMGLIRPREWSLLSAQAMADKPLMARVDSEWAHLDLTPEEKLEEAVAEMYAGHVHDQTFNAPSGVKLVLGRIKNFLDRVANALRGQGFKTADDVMSGMMEGALGDRERTGGESALSTPQARAAGLKITPKDGQDLVSDSLDGLRKFALNLITPDQMAHYYKPMAPEIRLFTDALSRREPSKNDKLSRSAQAADLQKQLKGPARAAFDKFVYDADALDERVPVSDPGSSLHAAYRALPADARAAYDAGRADYKLRLADYIKLRKDMIAGSDLTDAERASAVKELDAFAAQVNPNHWSRKRFGDLVAVSKTADYTELEADYKAKQAAVDAAVKAGASEADVAKLRGEAGDASQALRTSEAAGGRSVSHFDKRSEILAHKAAMEAQGYQVNTMARDEFNSAHLGDSSEMRVVNAAMDRRINEAQAEADRATGKEKDDALRTVKTLLAMKSMASEIHASFSPEGSAFRAGMRRKGVPGFSDDAVRAFAVSAHQDAGYMSAIEFGSRARDALSQMREKALKTGRYENYQAYLKLKAHYDSLSDYASLPMTRFLLSGAYAYNLMGSPSFTVMHLMQTPLVTLPEMGAQFGHMKAAGALAKAAGEVVAARRGPKGGHTDLDSLGKTPAERAMLTRLEAQNVFQSTVSGSIRQMANPTSPLGKLGDHIMAVASFLPHHTERFNRFATALADFRLAQGKKGIEGTVDDKVFAQAQKDGWTGSRADLAAAEHARSMTLDTHVDYSRENAPAYMRHPAARLMMQFQKYQQAMLELEARHISQMMDKSLTGPERRAAGLALAGVIGAHVVTTGLMGAPGFGLAAFGANLYHKFGPNKNDPWDADTAFRRTLNEQLGPEVGSVFARGALYLPLVKNFVPADVTDRLGMGDLGSPGDRIEGVDRDDLLKYIGSTVGGPAASMLGNLAHGYTLMQEGRTERGLEMWAPKAARDLMKTYRFANEGVETELGAPIVAQADITPADLAAQAAGFTPQKVETAQENRQAIEAAQAQFKARKGSLVQMYEHAVTDGDTDGANAAADRITAFNGHAAAMGLLNEMIKPQEMSRAVQQHYVERARLMDGLSLAPNQRMLYSEGFDNPLTGS